METPDGEEVELPGSLKLLRAMVYALMGVMIVGLVVLVAVFVTRFGGAPDLPLPETITLPDGATATHFTIGPDWYAVVTETGDILIFDRDTGALRQTVTID